MPAARRMTDRKRKGWARSWEKIQGLVLHWSPFVPSGCLGATDNKRFIGMLDFLSVGMEHAEAKAGEFADSRAFWLRCRC